MNKTIKGGDMMVFAEGKSIACATSHTLSLSMETTETSSKDSGGGWSTYEAGVLGWTASSENVASTGKAGLTYDDLVDMMIAREPIHLVFGPKKEAGENVPASGWTPAEGKGREGDAFITSVEENAPNGENATFTVQFTGTGPLTKVAAAAQSDPKESVDAAPVQD